MLEFIFHDSARIEFRQIVHYYAINADESVAIQFRNVAHKVVTKIRANPLHYRTIYKTVRHVILEKPFGEYYTAAHQVL